MAPSWRTLALMLMIAWLVRLPLIPLKFTGFPPGWGGEMSSVARSIAIGNGFGSPYWEATGPTALVPPVYPYLLSWLYSIFGVYTEASGYAALHLNAILSAATCIPAFLIGSRAFNRPVGLAAGWLWALYPLTGYSELLFIWNTSLYALILSLVFLVPLVLQKDHGPKLWFGYGLLIGFGLLVESVLLAFLPFLFIWCSIQRRVAVRKLALAVVGLVLVTLPWIARNSLQFDRVMFIRSGLALEMNRGLQERDYMTTDDPIILPNRDKAELARYRQLGEIGYMEEKQADVMNFVRQNPADFILRVLRRYLAFWTGGAYVSHIYWFYGRFLPLKHLIFTLPSLAGALTLFQMVRNGHPQWALFASLLAVYPIIYAFTTFHPRFRAPIEPILIVLTAVQVVAAVERVRPLVVTRLESFSKSRSAPAL